MFKGRRISIAVLMAVVFFVAADFAIVRGLWQTNEPMVIAITTLPMINLLLLVLPRLRRDCGRRLFWIGFEAVGWSMVLLFSLWTLWDVDSFIYPIGLIDAYDGLPSSSPAEVALLISCAVVIYTAPQALVAAWGGWFCSRYRVVIERRPSSAAESGLT